MHKANENRGKKSIICTKDHESNKRQIKKINSVPSNNVTKSVILQTRFEFALTYLKKGKKRIKINSHNITRKNKPSNITAGLYILL